MNTAQRKRRRAIYFAARALETYCINAWLLPDDFDDDTRIAEAVLRYHPPRAWVDAAC